VVALAKLVSKQKKHRFLRTLISQEFTETRLAPYLTKEGWLRASSMYRLCAREEALAGLMEFVRKDVVTADLNIIFQHGHALHYQLQNEILPRLGVFVGQWRCQWCMKLHGGWEEGEPPERTLVARPKACSCGKSDFIYNEIMFEDESIRINGHPDGFLKIPGLPGLGLLEAKSIGMRGGLEIRKAPNIGHVIQAQTYMMLTGLKWAKILYWQKTENGLNALVEHLVNYDQGTIDGIRAMVSSIWRALSTGELPERICEVASCNRAKECAMAEACFANAERLRVLQ
jgi:hypothetical protein